MWDDEVFVQANDLNRNIWQLLLTGPQRSALPGLQRGGMATLAETLRRPVKSVTDGFNWWVSRGRAVFIASVRVIWVPNAPEYNEAESPNQIRAWWNRWKEIPECGAKYKHIVNLNAFAGLEKPSHVQTWDQTFSTVDQALGNAFDDSRETLQEGLPGIDETLPDGSTRVRARGRASSDSDSPRIRDSDGDKGGGPGAGGVEGLSDAERAIRDAIVADPNLAPIVKLPASLARDLFDAGPGLDVPHVVRDAGRWLRANPARKKSNGNQFLVGWVKREQERRGGRPTVSSGSGPSRAVQPAPQLFTPDEEVS